MVRLDEFLSKPAGARSAPGKAVGALKAAYVRVRDRVSPNGWVLTDEMAVKAPDHLIVRFAMHREGIEVSACGVVIGPGQSVEFAKPANRRVKGVLDAMGEPEFHRLIETWADDVRAGIAHRWRHEARRHGESRL
jgi:hypothetical protein